MALSRIEIQYEVRNGLQRACTIPEVNTVGHLVTSHDQWASVGQDPPWENKFPTC